MTQHTHRVLHIIMCTQKKPFEFLKYNTICSLTAILIESISKLCGLSMKFLCTNLRNGENYVTFIVQLKMKRARFE
jgi:membrane-bound metal-dependent hydrolase YbcI (DUF457 family)